MPTAFTAKQSGEKLYAAEINQIYSAINLIELALSLTPGTSTASIDPSQLAPGIPASKLDPASSATLTGLQAQTATVGTLAADEIQLGSQGVLRVFNGTRDVLVLGRYDATQNQQGLLASDGTRTTLLVDASGQVTLRGMVYADPGSQFTGTIVATGGQFAGTVTVGGNDGLLIDGTNKKIQLGVNGQLVAGNTILSASGIQIQQGSINLGNGRFVVASDGTLTATGATLSGTITAQSGQIGGITIASTGLHVGGLGPTTTGFSLGSDGTLYAKQGSFTGEIHAQSGTLGNLTVTGTLTAGNTTLSSNGLAMNQGQINLNNQFVVDATGYARMTNAEVTGRITATSGAITGELTVGGHVTLSPSGIQVSGGDGVTLSTGGGLTVLDGQIRLLDGQGREILRLGAYQDGASTVRGLRITHPTLGDTFKVDESGNVTLRGAVYASSGTFTGRIEAQDGYFSNVQVTGTVQVAQGGAIQAGGATIDDTGIHLHQGSIQLGSRFAVDEQGNAVMANAQVSGFITATGGLISGVLEVGTSGSGLVLDGPNQQIIAGQTVLSPNGLTMLQGSISLGGRFSVNNQGHLSATEAFIQGTIQAQAGLIGGITIESAGIHVGGLGPATTGFSLGSDGTLYAKQGSFTGEIHAQSGTLGDLTVTGTLTAGTSTISADGLHIRQGSINLNDRFVVDDTGHAVLTSAEVQGQITATGGRILGLLEVGSAVQLSPDGIRIGGSGGLLVYGQEGIRIVEGSLVVLNPQSHFLQPELPASDFQADLTEVVRLGRYEDEAGIQYGLRVLSQNQTTFKVDRQGNVFVRGAVEATSGRFDGELVMGPEGRIVAGQISLTSAQLKVTDAQGNEQVVLGEVSSGTYGLKAGGVVLQATGLSGPGFTLSSSGMTASQGSIGGWNITSTALQADRISLASSGTLVVQDSQNAVQIQLGKLPDNTYGLLAGQVKLNGTGIQAPKFSVTGDGHLSAISATFGAANSPAKITLDASGLYAGVLGAANSPFGIYLQDDPAHGIQAGDAYFRGKISVAQSSEIGGDILVQSGGKIIVGSPTGKRIELIDSQTRTGLFAFDSQNQERFAISLEAGGIDVRGAIAVTGGSFSGNVTVGTDQSVRIVGAPVAGTAESIQGIYLYEPDPSTKIVRLSFDGLSFSPDGGVTWYPAMTGGGITANAITDGTLYIHDTTVGGAASGIVIRKQALDEPVQMPNDTSYVKLAHRNITVWRVTNTGKTIAYTEGVDYTVNQVDGLIARLPGSSIPPGATVLVTYFWNVIDVNSEVGIRIYEANIEVESPVTGTTLIGGGYLRVKGLDVGVFQSDNFVTNGNFSHVSTAWGTARTNDGADLVGYPPYPPGEPFYGDWYTDRSGRTYRYGAAYWIPNKSDTTFDEMGMMTGYAQVSFAPNDFLHNIYGYANLIVAGSTYQWCQIEQDVYPFFNYSDGDFIIPTERFEEVVVSAGFHWHKTHTPRNTISLEVDELVPHFVFVESSRTTPFTPIWDNVQDTYSGLVYSANDWTFNDDPFNEHGVESTGDNLAYGAGVTSNASIIAGTASYAVDNHFMRESWATRTSGSGYHYLQIDLGSPQVINQIWVWHSMDSKRRYRNYKLEVSADGATWTTIYDTTRATNPDPPYAEGISGKKHTFAPMTARYIRDWIDGYEVLDEAGQPTGVAVQENQWLDIQVRRTGYMQTNRPGAWVEWTFTPKSRCDLWIGFIRGPGHGVGYVEIDGKRVATIDQGTMIGDVDHPHYELAYIDLSSQEDFQIVPRKPHTLRIVFDPNVPSNQGKEFTLTRIKLEDFRLESEQYTTKLIIASANIRPANPYAFYYPSVVPRKAQNYTGKGRQILRGMYDVPSNYSPSSNCWIRYRIRIRSEQAAGGDLHEHNHVMVSHVVMEYGTKPTRFRRSSFDITPSHFLHPWNPELPDATGIHTEHLADQAVTGPKIAPGAITDAHIADNAAIAESKLALNYPTHGHPNKNILDQITGFGTSGTSTDVARADHDHNNLYYTKANLQTSGQSQVHWGNLVSVPSEFNPRLASATVRGGVKIGTGLQVGADEQLSVVFAGSGSANSAARSDHVHSYSEIQSRPIRRWEVVELTAAIAQNMAYTLPNGLTYAPNQYELAIYLDGRRLLPGHDYQETSATQVTFLLDIPSGSHLLFDVIPLH